MDAGQDLGLSQPLPPSDQAWPGDRGRQAQQHLEAWDRSEHPEAGWSAKEGIVRGYVVIFEGDDETGHSAYSPDLPGVVAAGDSRKETEQLMRSAMADHILLLKEAGEPVPEPSDAADVTLLDPAAA
jgi:predicted RNase H-like HicB family nuclease